MVAATLKSRRDDVNPKAPSWREPAGEFACSPRPRCAGADGMKVSPDDEYPTGGAWPSSTSSGTPGPRESALNHGGGGISARARIATGTWRLGATLSLPMRSAAAAISVLFGSLFLTTSALAGPSVDAKGLDEARR